MKNVTLSLASLLFAASAVTANDDIVIDIKPGKWKHEYSMTSESGNFEQAMDEVRKQLNALPESQRRMVEDMMAQQGIDLDMQGATLEMCITAEEIRQGMWTQQDGCTQTMTEGEGDTFHVRFSCDSNPPTSGEGTFRIHDPTRYSALVNVKTEFNGQPETLVMEQKGTWLQAECDG
ncbi:MAG: DUF3617 domain-containing protein [Gammaproteobacteria bacterium]|nr:DUF3617 domain-containing protein [Gammaproteobacteria bacterium]